MNTTKPQFISLAEQVAGPGVIELAPVVDRCQEAAEALGCPICGSTDSERSAPGCGHCADLVQGRTEPPTVRECATRLLNALGRATGTVGWHRERQALLDALDRPGRF